MSLPTRPEEIVRILDEVISGAEKLRSELRWVHSVAHGRNPAPSSDTVKSSGHTDPTGSLVVSQEIVRSHYRSAVAMVLRAKEDVRRALEKLASAVEAADYSEDNRLLPREYDIPRSEPTVSKREKREAVRYQEKRHRMGLGFGES